MVVTREKLIKLSSLLAVLFVVGFALFGVYSLFNDLTDTNTESQVSEIDQGEELTFEDSNITAADFGDKNPNDIWNSTEDPLLIGSSLGRVLDNDEGLEKLSNELSDFLDEYGTDVNEYSEQQLAEFEELNEKIRSYRSSAYLTDEEVERYLVDEAANIYLQWRDEYFDDEGNQLKPFPESE